MDEPLWVKIPEKTQEHWLELKEPNGWYSAYVKWDGCIGFYRYFNTPMEPRPTEKEWQDQTDHIHICDLDDMIKRLQALKEEAIKHFGNDWS